MTTIQFTVDFSAVGFAVLSVLGVVLGLYVVSFGLRMIYRAVTDDMGSHLPPLNTDYDPASQEREVTSDEVWSYREMTEEEFWAAESQHDSSAQGSWKDYGYRS